MCNLFVPEFRIILVQSIMKHQYNVSEMFAICTDTDMRWEMTDLTAVQLIVNLKASVVFAVTGNQCITISLLRQLVFPLQLYTVSCISIQAKN